MAGLKYGIDYRKPIFSIILQKLLYHRLAELGRILNNRAELLPEAERRGVSAIVWQQGTTRGWEMRAFNHPQERCKGFAYEMVNKIAEELGREISVLEFGCMNGGSLHCIEFLGYKVKKFIGIDISRASIVDAKRRFPDNQEAEFHAGDFIDVISNGDIKSDVCFFKLTAFFLDENYLTNLVALIVSREVCRYIIFQESTLLDVHGSSRILDAEQVPTTYAHDYDALMIGSGCELYCVGAEKTSLERDLLPVRRVYVNPRVKAA